MIMNAKMEIESSGPPQAVMTRAACSRPFSKVLKQTRDDQVIDCLKTGYFGKCDPAKFWLKSTLITLRCKETARENARRMSQTGVAVSKKAIYVGDFGGF